MAHPTPSSRSLEFFLDLGNLTTSVGGNVVQPPNTAEWWESQGVGTHYGVEFTVYKAFRTAVEEEAAALGEIYWDSVVLGLENGPEPLFGFKISYKAYMEVITKTPIYGPAPEGGGPAPVTGYTWNGTRTYPEATVTSQVLSNSQQRTPTLWPRNIDTPEEEAWRDRVFSGQSVQWSTAITPRRFEGITLYGCDQLTVSDVNPGIVGIAEGSARCLGFIESRDNLTPNFVAPGDYYVEANTMQAFMRTPDDRIEPVITRNNGAAEAILPIEGGGLAGRIDHPDELPIATENNPITVGTTYLQRRDPLLPVPFAGFIGTALWVYVGYETPDPDDPEGGPMLDRNGEIIEDFMWLRSQRPEAVSGYNYVLVFDQSIFEYIQRMGGPFAEQIRLVEPAITGDWFPSEPWDPEADPPIYPIDTIPAFVPDQRETVDVFYSLAVETSLASGSINITQTCIAPTRDWGKMLKALLNRCYYTHAISRSYADVPGYCNPDSPRYGENFTDPSCEVQRDEIVVPWLDENGNPIPIGDL